MSEGGNRTGRIAVLAAVVGAVFGSATTGAMSYLNTTTQLDRHAEQSQHEFVRDQRIALYSGVISHNSAAIIAEHRIVGLLEAQHVDANGLRAELKGLTEAVEQLRQDSIAIVFLGSQPCNKAVSKLLKGHDTYRAETAALAEAVITQPSGTNLSVGHAMKFNEETSEVLGDALAEFIVAAKADLGV